MKLTPRHALAAAAVPLAALAACTSPPPTSTAASPATSTASPTTAAPTPTASTQVPGESNTTPTDPHDTSTPGPGRIGGTALALPGDVKVAVGKPERHAVPSSVGNSAGTTRTGNQIAVFTVAVTSTGKSPIDMINTAVTAYAGGEKLDLIDYSEVSADNHFTGTLLPGKTMKAKFAFLLRKSDTDLQVEVYVGEQGASHGVFTSGNAAT